MQVEVPGLALPSLLSDEWSRNLILLWFGSCTGGGGLSKRSAFGAVTRSTTGTAPTSSKCCLWVLSGRVWWWDSSEEGNRKRAVKYLLSIFFWVPSSWVLSRPVTDTQGSRAAPQGLKLLTNSTMARTARDPTAVPQRKCHKATENSLTAGGPQAMPLMAAHCAFWVLPQDAWCLK